MASLFAIWRAMEKNQKTTYDRPALTKYAVLVIAFAALTTVVSR